MSDFYKKFLLEEVPRVTTGTNKQIFLAAFGKHPGWDDHVEDLGLETGSLISAKILFYVQGIGGEVDAGAWEKLDESQRLATFKHVFVWHRPGQVLIGRLWSSSDGKGRTRYPMVVCAHCAGVSLSWALDHVLPRLEQIEQACVATQSAVDVRSILARFRAELRGLISGQMTDLGPPNLDTAFLTRFAARPELGPQQEGWMRILYAVQNQFGAFSRGKFNPKSVASTIRPQQIRLPRAADSVSKGILQWCNFFLTQVDPQTPLLITVPLEEQWLDVTAGEPTSQEVFSLRASPKAMPLASEVPYNLSREFREQVRGVLVALESGKPPGSILAFDSYPVSNGPAPAKRGLFKWLGGGAALLLLALAIIWGMGQQDGSSSGPKNDVAAAAPAAAEPLTVAARPPEPTVAAPTGSLPAPPNAGSVATVTATDLSAANRIMEEKEEKRLVEEKRAIEEKAKADAAARLKAMAEDREKVRFAAEAEAQRLAEEKRVAEEKAKVAPNQFAGINPEARRVIEPESIPLSPASVSSPRPQHTNVVGMIFVQLPAGYWVGKYEVSQAEFEKVVSRNPSAHKSPSHPVESVTWEDAIEFCRKLTALESSAARLMKGWIYALPTEVQWNEFVAGAELEHAVTSQKAKRTRPEPVGSLGANPLGLHDVRGNVWEWCQGPGDQKALRGGGYDGFTATGLAPTLAVPYRWSLAADQRKPQAGFRCVLVKQP